MYAHSQDTLGVIIRIVPIRLTRPGIAIHAVGAHHALPISNVLPQHNEVHAVGPPLHGKLPLAGVCTDIPSVSRDNIRSYDHSARQGGQQAP